MCAGVDMSDQCDEMLSLEECKVPPFVVHVTPATFQMKVPECLTWPILASWGRHMTVTAALSPLQPEAGL